MQPGVGGTGSYARSKQSENAVNVIPGATFDASDSYTARFDASWELDLFGSLSYEAADADQVFESDSQAYRFGPSFRWALFQGGRIRENIRAEDARVQQVSARYGQTLLLVLEEVENALVAFVQEQERRKALDRSVTATRRSVELARELYVAGQTFAHKLNAPTVYSGDRMLSI